MTSLLFLALLASGEVERLTNLVAQSGDILTILINWGGFAGDIASGILYLLTTWLGYSQPDMAGQVHDYGTKFLVTAGLLNVLAMVDAYEIAGGRKS